MRKFILPAIAVIALAVTFNSCSMEKRHYLKGYYIDRNNHKEVTANPSVNTTKEISASGNAAAEKAFLAPVKVNTTATAPVSEKSVFQKSIITPKAKKTAVAVIRRESAKAESAQSVSKNNTTIQQSTFREKQESQGGGDVSTVVLVILAIFIPPLAVYLYEGSWTKRCTINLILTLLCGLPGMIHALIVVLS